VTETPTATSTWFSQGDDPILTPIVYPNPLSVAYGSNNLVQAMVSVTLNQSAKVMTIQLFTTAYRKIGESTVNDVPVGIHSYPLPIKDLKGKQLANGVYYVVVTTSAGRAVGKLMILK